MDESQKPLAKVLFRVHDSEGPSHVETLWATALGDDRYRVENSPFYAYSVSWEDVVIAPFDADEGFPTFRRVLSKSGNRTVRVIFEPPIEPGNVSDDLLHGLLALGCSYEGASSSYLAINVPPGVELSAVAVFLVDRNATWEYADPSYDELFPDTK